MKHRENSEILQYLYDLSRFGIKPGLATMERMMEALDHPERKFQSVHVTGTNGKGSTCAMIESVLRTAGYTTALYTSPHLYVFNERIRVAGQPITDGLLSEYVSEIRAVCEKRDIHPTFFEFTSALAFLHFARSNIDIAIIEVGMGGRYDATNVITPLISVITNVGLDHMEFLGSTKAEIAKEKAGIIKEGVPVITAEEDRAILDIFYEEAREKHASVTRVQEVVGVDSISSGLDGQEVTVQLLTPSRSPLSKGEKYGVIISSPHMRGGGVGSFRVRLPLLGSHQVKNLATALSALVAFQASQSHRPEPHFAQGLRGAQRERGFTISQDAMVVGISKTSWEGRLDVVSHSPLVIVDGAHNPDGVHALREFLTVQHLQDRCGVLVFAAKKGKDISDMIDAIIPLFHTVIVTEGAYMPESAEKLAKRIGNAGPRVIVEQNVREAVRIGVSHMKSQDMMLVTGSLYMIPEALSYFRQASYYV